MRPPAPEPQAVGPEAAAALAAIHATAFDRPWDAAAFADLLAGSGVVALTAGDEGFILLRRVLDEAEVLTLAVRPAARRRGVARALVEAAALTQAAGVATLWLEVAEDNAAALALYEGAGFVRAGARPGYYPRGGGAESVAAVVMKRSLAPNS